MQGMAARISRKDLLTPAFGEAIQKVLQDPGYAAAAAEISRKLRARQRTPKQEAAGMSSHSSFSHYTPQTKLSPTWQSHFSWLTWLHNKMLPGFSASRRQCRSTHDINMPILPS